MKELKRDMGKVLVIVSDLAVGQKRLEKKVDALEQRVGGLEHRVGGLEQKTEILISAVTESLRWNKDQDKRLDRIDTHLGLPSLI